MNQAMRKRAVMLIVTMLVITAVSTRLKADTGTCGGATTTLPFTDVLGSNIFFCSIAEAYVSGLTNGTSATTYSPSDVVTREQMAAFVTRAMDQSLKRGSERAALDQFWTTQSAGALGLTSVGSNPATVASDGTNLWVANRSSGTVSQIRASDSRKLNNWTGASSPFGVLVAAGKVFVAGQTNPGSLFEIDPAGPPAMNTLTVSLGALPLGIAFDGERIWTANFGGSVSIVTLSPVTVTNVTIGFSAPYGITYDGANIWVTDAGTSSLKKLDSMGNIIMSVPVGSGPVLPVFDGENIWVPNVGSNSVSVVRATGGLAGTVLATLTGNGLNGPAQASFDGERVLVTNPAGNSISLWRASDLAPNGTFSSGASSSPFGACSDGLNFWITLQSTGRLARL